MRCLVLSVVVLGCVVDCFAIRYVGDGILVLNDNNNYTELLGNISSLQQCLCYAFNNNSYLGLNYFKNNRTCLLFRNYSDIWPIRSDENSSFWFIRFPVEMLLTSQWNTATSMATARYAHTATLLSSGKVLITGGYGSSGVLASSEIFDPSTGQWNPTASLATARDTHIATMLSSGKVLITGGYGSSDALASSEIFDPLTGQWNYIASMITARCMHTATLLNSGKVLVTGGFQSSCNIVGSSGSMYILAISEIYDP
ncbi:unnamed protein product [Didymodactylos carnosus]|uniref:Uncharacterized protein n=1 Tax=Didymodactylos carnosus TaxID=1234261 RepID=A0A814SA06_9BILA|nr:unnamed protein product [Didymodactylos carnosus]CAF1143321.1 unnamed protein product [Didymodactylos carnosus]CAF3649600.1 unnamed protein product [Didymodactylos carnosus]CAF3906945.1 unnamed protein product [Didymodactylos carnosus]